MTDSIQIDTKVFDELWVTLGVLAGDYDTTFAPGKVLAGKKHQQDALKLMRVFDIRLRTSEAPDTMNTQREGENN